jgi:hypothetical protein
MADRFNRVFLRTLRALSGMRKAQLVAVQNANQANVARRQVNVASGGGGRSPATHRSCFSAETPAPVTSRRGVQDRSTQPTPA